MKELDRNETMEIITLVVVAMITQVFVKYIVLPIFSSSLMYGLVVGTSAYIGFSVLAILCGAAVLFITRTEVVDTDLVNDVSYQREYSFDKLYKVYLSIIGYVLIVGIILVTPNALLNLTIGNWILTDGLSTVISGFVVATFMSKTLPNSLNKIGSTLVLHDNNYELK